MNIKQGYKAFTGHIFTQAEADRYNRVTAEIEREQYPATIEILKNERHRVFCAIVGVQGF